MSSYSFSSNKIDSLESLFKKRIESNQIDKSIVDVSFNIYDYYVHNNPKIAMNYILKVFELNHVHNLGREVDIYNIIGLLNQELGNFDDAINYFAKSLEITLESNNYYKAMHGYNYIGNTFFSRKLYNLARNNYLKSLEIANDDSYEIQTVRAVSINNLALIYLEEKKYDSAESKFKEAFEVRNKLKDTVLIIHSLQYLADLSAIRGNYNEAENYIEKAWNLIKLSRNSKINDAEVDYAIFTALKIRAKVDVLIGKEFLVEETRAFADSILTDKMKSESSAFLYKWNFNLGEAYLLKKDFQKSIKSFNDALNSAISVNNKYRIMNVYEMLKKVYQEFNDLKNYNFYSAKYFIIKDSLDDIALHHQLNILSEFEHTNEFNKKLKEQEEARKIEDRNRLIISLVSVIVLIIIIIIAIIYYKKYKINQKLNQELKDLNATKDKFFSIIAHDLRNPISNFKQMTDILAVEYQYLDDQEKIDFIDALNKSSKQIYNLLENLLTWSRSQRGVIEFHPLKNDLYYIVDNSIELLTASASNKEIKLINNIKPETFAAFDSNMITTVVRNLISNAIKFTNTGGTIEVFSNNDEKNLSISIKDSGVGISKETISNLFKIDSSKSTSGTNDEKGSGLGLILCKEFIDRHSGKIWVESELGVGTTFTFSIPENSDVLVNAQ